MGYVCVGHSSVCQLRVGTRSGVWGASAEPVHSAMLSCVFGDPVFATELIFLLRPVCSIPILLFKALRNHSNPHDSSMPLGCDMWPGF